MAPIPERGAGLCLKTSSCWLAGELGQPAGGADQHDRAGRPGAWREGNCQTGIWVSDFSSWRRVLSVLRESEHLIHSKRWHLKASPFWDCLGGAGVWWVGVG